MALPPLPRIRSLPPLLGKPLFDPTICITVGVIQSVPSFVCVQEMGQRSGDGTETALMVLDDLILGKGTAQSTLKVRSRGHCVINFWLVQLIWSGGLVFRP